ncbi:hypothetical protein DLAC_01590 [Tieghemostelium lacteum]|uniref:HIT-type domain-containing protein n=1 Tax=Tieghemostelium lacteum TaxID=361077 RepID=A0A152A5S3_TIELA|nr:hypothetical protein DLAC_01590 [Tieghemostelium lacteum]|eukprot:KYR01589.1 hypothetical protein DLAC_01590 [Tieghemostelium lacteum]
MNNKKTLQHLESKKSSFILDIVNNNNTNESKSNLLGISSHKKVLIKVLADDNIEQEEESDEIEYNVNRDTLNEDLDKLCKICSKQFSVYSCPRCFISYCSLNCYKNHNERCTTEFLESQIIENLQSLDKVDEKDSHHFLKRMKEIYDQEDEKFENFVQKVKQEENGDLDIDDNDSETEDIPNVDLSKLNIDEMTESQILSLLTKDQIEQFHQSIKDGTISNIIPDWVPWWNEPMKEESPILIQEVNNENETTIKDTPTTVPENSSKNQIFKTQIPPIFNDIQPFSDIYKSPLPPSKSLFFHLIDIIYCYCFVLKSFNGDWSLDNNEDLEGLIEGCSLAYEISVILKPFKPSDTKIQQIQSVSVILQMLLDQTHTTSITHPNQGNLQFSFSTIQDLIKIIQNKQYILSSLSHLYQNFSESILQSNNTLNKNTFKLISKKLLYFMSWVQSEDSNNFKSLASTIKEYYNSNNQVTQ